MKAPVKTYPRHKKVIWKFPINMGEALTENGQIFKLPAYSEILSCMFDVKSNSFVFWAEVRTDKVESEIEYWRIRVFETGKEFAPEAELRFVGTMQHFTGYMAHMYAGLYLD